MNASQNAVIFRVLTFSIVFPFEVAPQKRFTRIREALKVNGL